MSRRSELEGFARKMQANFDTALDAAFGAPVPAPRAHRQRRTQTPESAVLQQIRSGLRVLGVPHWRIAVGAFRVGVRFVKMGDAGLPDLVAFPRNGGAVFIEAKSPRGRLSPEQVTFRSACQAAGAVHVMARSIDDVLPWVR